ncbi:MAG: hypothetical protein WC645_03645 [Candidatus Margulisiibacteriota bacterium]
MTEILKVLRGPHLAEKVVFVDGLFGCGKTMLSPIVAALDRVELLTYSYEVEYVCALYHLGKIERDAAETMIKMLTDLKLYNTMMGREVNFRWGDLSSVFSDARPWRYFARLFQKGDRAVPERIAREKPILHLTSHHLLGFSEPIFAGLKDRVVFIELVRHPLYMIKQNLLNMENLICRDVRDVTIYFAYRDQELPYYVRGWEEQFLAANPMEKAIYYIQAMSKFTDDKRRMFKDRLGASIVTIPFEGFVTDPWPYLGQIEKALGTKVTRTTRRMMKKQRVPRRMYSAGIGLKIYKRCGWEPPKSAGEEQEFESRRQFAAERSSAAAMQALDRLCADYEEKYLRKKGAE